MAFSSFKMINGGKKNQPEESLEKEVDTAEQDKSVAGFSFPPENKLTRSLSVLSDESAFSVTSDDLNEPTVYTHAPFEVVGVADEIGRVRVAREGEKLPLEKWKLKKGIAIKFSVSATLEVTIINKRNLADQAASNESFSACALVSSTNRKRSSSSFRMEESLADSGPSQTRASKSRPEDRVGICHEADKVSKQLPGLQEGGKLPSRQEWLSELDRDFVNIVVGGLEVGLRDNVANNIREKVKMTPKQNMSLINSINHHIFMFLGKQRPDSSLCSKIAALFKKYIPEDFGSFAMKSSKGDGVGGLESLSERIASNFYNRYVRSSSSLMENLPSNSKIRSKEKEIMSKPKLRRSVKSKICIQSSEISAWEQKRLDNIKECQAMLHMLGLIKTKPDKVKIKRPKKVHTAGPVRRSKRLNCDQQFDTNL